MSNFKRIQDARVAVIQCDSYDTATVDTAVQRGIELLGGREAFASSGEKILFKPNILWGTDPAKCVVTHPAVLRACIKVFTGMGAELLYGDSPAGFSKTVASIEKCGYHHALASLPVKIASFDTHKEVAFPEGKVSKRLKIADTVLAADAVINVPKLKSHGLTRITGAVKNLFGCIPGLLKGEHHARFPDIYEFSALIADIAAFVRPRLHIMDAVEAMEGNGPQSGIPKKLGVLLISMDPVALDTIACRLVNLNPAFVPTIAAGVAAGLGISDASRISLVGDDVHRLCDKKFLVTRKPPERVVMTGVLNNIRRYFCSRPTIVRKKCTMCGRCISVCPVTPKAVDRSSATAIPTFHYGKCIRCFCCQEVCPSQAIVIKGTLLKVFFPFGPYISLLITRNIIHKKNFSDD